MHSLPALICTDTAQHLSGCAKFALQDAATLDATGKNTYPAAQIIQDIDSLLSTLQTDHFDVGFFSWPIGETLVDETLDAYARLLKEGKILALGGMDLGVGVSVREISNPWKPY